MLYLWNFWPKFIFWTIQAIVGWWSITFKVSRSPLPRWKINYPVSVYGSSGDAADSDFILFFILIFRKQSCFFCQKTIRRRPRKTDHKNLLRTKTASRLCSALCSVGPTPVIKALENIRVQTRKMWNRKEVTFWCEKMDKTDKETSVNFDTTVTRQEHWAKAAWYVLVLYQKVVSQSTKKGNLGENNGWLQKQGEEEWREWDSGERLPAGPCGRPRGHRGPRRHRHDPQGLPHSNLSPSGLVTNICFTFSLVVALKLFFTDFCSLPKNGLIDSCV